MLHTKKPVKMAPPKKAHGKGAVVSILIKFMHPSALIQEKFPNPENWQRLEGCLTVRQEVKKISCKDQLSLVVTHDDFKDADGNLQELHAIKKHFSIQEEGDLDLFFDIPQERQEETMDTPLLDAVANELSGGNHGGLSDLVVALSGVVDVDDDNQPAPENIPAMTDTPSIISTEWGHEGVCFRNEASHPNSPAVLIHPVDTTRDDTNLQLYEDLFPKNFLQEVMIPTMNQKLSNAVSYSELLSWIGLWILMSVRSLVILVIKRHEHLRKCSI